VKQSIDIYRQAWQEAGHPGQGDVTLRMPVYVGETRAQAIADTKTSTLAYYRRLAQNLGRSVGRAGTVASEERARMAQELANISYETLLRDWVVYGTPTEVTERLQQLHDDLDLSGFILEMNAGGLIPNERVLHSLRLFGEEVAPRFRS
jgi:alkanesulfonate monooxygenase SsuD/methylene tetrahydromethanopterin reductase-like flavin-dependent oxidoreductase (luciferase family)